MKFLWRLKVLLFSKPYIIGYMDSEYNFNGARIITVHSDSFKSMENQTKVVLFILKENKL